MDEELRERFMRTYSGLPFKLRGEIIAVVDGEPVTWKVAHQEIKQGTEKGEEILKKLEKTIFVEKDER